MGNVTGDPKFDGTSYITNTNAETEQHHAAIEKFVNTWHTDLHNEIEDNDLNPGESKKKAVLTSKK
jgi:hypothetical protein